jgi:predicted ATPase/DNA-binding CsgD family transcriptional regulator
VPASIGGPPASGSATRRPAGNLPQPLSGFVGRRREVREIRRLLPGSRLVTLTGIGGVGKTRLAVRVAGEVRRLYPDGVWLADLTDLHDPTLVRDTQDPEMLAQLVAAVLRIPVQPGRSPLDRLREALAARQLLLVLDCCEHLLESCAVLVDRVLHACPGVRVVATSREPLMVYGEVTFPVPPLEVPAAEVPLGGQSPATVAQVESVALFAARAAAVLPGFEVTAGNQEAVSAICRRLDGLPLAIELAAAQMRVLTPHQIVDRLANRFAVLRRGARTGPKRLQTLRACLQWSFELCSKPERALWARLSVFSGGAELDAVEAVCAGDNQAGHEQAGHEQAGHDQAGHDQAGDNQAGDKQAGEDQLELVTALVDKSILVRADDGRVARYRMLESVRDFGLEELRGSGEDAAVRRRHRDWCLRLAGDAEREWISDRQPYWAARLGREHANIRGAVEYCLAEPGEAESALRIAVSLPPMHWIARALFREGRQWLDRALAQATRPTAVRARALLLDSQLAIGQGDPGAGAELLDRGEALARQLAATTELGYATYLRGLVLMFREGDLPAAIGHFEKALAAPPDVLRIDLLLTLGHAAGLLGDSARTAALEEEVLRLTRPWDQGFYRARVVWGRALAAWRNGELDSAAALVSERLRPLRTSAPDDRYGIALSVEVLAWIAAAAHRPRRAATLLGAADSLWTEIGSSIGGYRYLEPDHRECERRARAELGDDAFGEAFGLGRGFGPEQTVSYAVGAAGTPARKPSVATPADDLLDLSRREREVAALVAEGLTNREIAGRLVISQRTAESHVDHILTKLGLTGRAQIAAWIGRRRRRLPQPER